MALSRTMKMRQLAAGALILCFVGLIFLFDLQSLHVYSQTADRWQHATPITPTAQVTFNVIPGQVAWSPNGKYLAAAAGDVIYLYAYGSTLQPLDSLHNDIPGFYFYSVSWSPDSQRLAGAGTNEVEGLIDIWNIQTRKMIKTLRDSSVAEVAVAWSPDGKRLASMGQEVWFAVFAQGNAPGPLQAVVRLWDTATWSVEKLVPYVYTFATFYDSSLIGTLDGIGGLVWSPDGKYLAIPGMDNFSPDTEVDVIDADTGNAVAYTDLGDATSPAVSMTWDDKRGLAFVAYGSVVTYRDPLQMAKTTDSDLRKYTNTSSLSVAWSPDGQRLAVGGGSADQTGTNPGQGSLTILDAATDTPVFNVSLDKSVSSIAWSPDGRVIASIGADVTTQTGALQIWKLDPVQMQIRPDQPTITPYPTQEPNAIPSAVAPDQPLILTALCSEAPAAEWVWQVTNPNPNKVLFTWQFDHAPDQGGVLPVDGTQTGGSNKVVFYTNIVPGANALSIFVNGVLQDTKPANRSLCPTPTVTPTLTPSATPLVQPLRVRPVCSPGNQPVLLWAVINTNPFDIPFTWKIAQSQLGQMGSGVAPAAKGSQPGQAIVQTISETKIHSGDDLLQVFVDMPNNRQGISADSVIGPCVTVTALPTLIPH